MKVLFIHHSTGANLINGGKLREHLKKLNPKIELWDHSYNLIPGMPSFIAKLRYHTGLSDSEGKMLNKDFDITISNNSPREYAEIFSRDKNDITLRQILEFDMILFKNCYPTSNIKTQSQLEEYKRLYKQIRDNLAKYPDKIFVLITQPPLNRFMTTKDNAERARELTNWLASQEFQTIKNLKVFNFFDLLADENNYMKSKYQQIIPFDGHPNRRANREIAPKLAEFIVQSKELIP